MRVSQHRHPLIGEVQHTTHWQGMHVRTLNDMQMQYVIRMNCCSESVCVRPIVRAHPNCDVFLLPQFHTA